jgi:hypothetical protein
MCDKEIRPDCKDWLVKLTESQIEQQQLNSNHYTELKVQGQWARALLLLVLAVLIANIFV